MAHYDHTEAARKKGEREAWENFVKNERSKKKPNVETLLALRYAEGKIQELNECEEEIKKYKTFFSTLKSFLPKSFSTNTPIY
jgi:hypothetical protein